MRQIPLCCIAVSTATIVPIRLPAEGKSSLADESICKSAPWHRYCFSVSVNDPNTTQRSWMPSRPNSRSTGLLARLRFRTKAPRPRATIRCRSASRSLWRNLPSASAPRAASTEEHAIPFAGGSFAVARTNSGETPDNPIPLARYLPPGGLFFAVGAARGRRRRDGGARMRGWPRTGDGTKRRG